MSSEQKPGFTVTDRRSFAGTTEAESPPATAERPPEPAAPPPAAAEPPHKEARPTGALPPVDFGTFVLSLGSSAIMHLGDFENPESGKTAKDLPMAKHTIDLLSMLQAKTKGNLTPQEDKLLESLLYDLRIRYVAASKA
jgi:hypothetical protein